MNHDHKVEHSLSTKNIRPKYSVHYKVVLLYAPAYFR